MAPSAYSWRVAYAAPRRRSWLRNSAVEKRMLLTRYRMRRAARHAASLLGVPSACPGGGNGALPRRRVRSDNRRSRYDFSRTDRLGMAQIADQCNWDSTVTGRMDVELALAEGDLAAGKPVSNSLPRTIEWSSLIKTFHGEL